jgi:hypothetical protein
MIALLAIAAILVLQFVLRDWMVRAKQSTLKH